MPDQGVSAEVLCEEVAGLRVQLNVAGGREVFLSHHHHVLGDKREGTVAEPLRVQLTTVTVASGGG